MNSISSEKSSNIFGDITVPGDKSISHRALIIGSVVTGRIKIKNLLESEDVLATSNALRTLGIKINKTNNIWEVFGQGIGSLYGNNYKIDMGNSGTGARLLMGLIAGSDVEATIIGDTSLSKRPMKRIILPLIKTGAIFSEPKKNNLPITLKGSKIPEFPISIL